MNEEYMNKKKLKIVVINNHPLDALGGSEIQCDIIGNELTKLGHNVTYLAIDGSQTNYETPYKVIPISSKPVLISKTVIEEKPDIVYWRNNKKKFYKSVRLIKKERIPIIFAVSSINDVLKWSKFRKRLKGHSYVKHYLSNIKKVVTARWNYKGFSYVDGLTSLNKDYLECLDVENKKYIPNSMSMEQTEFKWNRPYVFWVANLKAHKRPEICLKVADAISDLKIDVLMVGKIINKHYEYYREWKNLPANLYYLGPKAIQEVNGILKNSICLFHTCKPEGFGNNFIQAWLQGKPTVSLEFDPGGLIEKHRMGLVSGNNVEQFTNDIKLLIEDSDLNTQLGNNAKEYATKHHHPDTNVKKLLSFMFKVANSSQECTEMYSEDHKVYSE